MGRLSIFIFLIAFGYIVYHVINILIRYRMTESFISNADGNPMVMLDESMKPINNPVLGTRDDNYFLMTSLAPGKKDIVFLKEKNPHHTSFYYVDDDGLKTEITDPNVVEHRTSKLSYPKIKDKLTCIPQCHPIRKVIKKHQPYMWEQANIINFYDTPLYRDWRYPLQPINIKFAANPEKYCELYPMAYPCAEYYSKW